MSSPFLSPEPQVKLEKYFPDPFKTTITTARTCYSKKGIIYDFDLKPGFETLAKDLYQAGHHTTIQHASFHFAISNVSRQFIWSFLHSHPFYNSEQVSQRYVEVKEGNVLIPPLTGEALEVYTQCVTYQSKAYQELNRILEPVTSKFFFDRFPGRKKVAESYKKEIQIKTQEIARYVLPVATFAYLYHTVSGITLLRYHRLCEQFDVPLEQKVIVKKMVAELLRVDPMYEVILEDSIALEENPEYEWLSSQMGKGTGLGKKSFLDEFDSTMEGKYSRLVDWKLNNEPILAQSVREVFGLTKNELNDMDAIDLVLNPAKNISLGEALNLTTHSKLSRTMFHPNYTFRKKISHTADSQDQRHRMTPASRPILAAHFSEEPDYIIPELIKQDKKCFTYYTETMEKIWTDIHRLKRLGVSDEFALYLLPNAVSVRFTESADLLNLHHKHAMRLCYNAQEEIWRASVEEAEQIREINPLIGKYLLPPCSIRYLAGTRPTCPEGTRFCGEKVWLMDLKDYQRVI